MPGDVTLTDLQELRLRPLTAAGQAWRDYSKALDEYAGRVNDDVAGMLVNSGWQGDAATVAIDRSERLREHFELRCQATELVAAVYEHAHERLDRLQTDLNTVVQTAHIENMIVHPDGRVEPTFHEDPGRADPGNRYQRAQELADQIADILEQANDVDQHTDEALRKLDPAVSRYGGGWSEIMLDAAQIATTFGLDQANIPTNETSETNAEWWNSLTEAEQSMYTMAYPELVGGMDGIPVETRDQANQLALQTTVASVTTDDTTRERAQDLLDRVDESRYGPEDQRLHILGYDLTQDGKAIISVGNPDTAANTAVWVPGVGSTIDNIGGDITRVRNIQEEASQMGDESDGVAAVMWLGYDAPESVWSVPAVTGDRAIVGGLQLDGFINGLRATDEVDDGRLTVIGHSYGSRVVGEAASFRDGLAVDDIIVAGSPGIGVSNVEELNLDPSNVWAGHAEGDTVSGGVGLLGSIHGHGPHGVLFGGNRFEVDTTGHSDYWDENTLSLRNQARIVVGDYDEVELEHGEAPQ